MVWLEVGWLYVQYRQVISPNPKPAATNRQLSWLVVAKEFMRFNHVDNRRVVHPSQRVTPFHRLKGNAPVPITSCDGAMTGLDWDLLLGRLFLVCQQITHPARWKWWRFVVWQLGPLLFYLFWGLWITSVVVNVVDSARGGHQLLSPTWWRNGLLCAVIVVWFGFGVHPVIGYYVKNSIETAYVSVLGAFVDQHCPELQSALTLARRFSRSVRFNFRLGLSWLFKRRLQPLGPFSMI